MGSKTPMSREELQEAAANGNEKALTILESLEGTDEDPMCPASGKRCPAVNFCPTAQAAKGNTEEEQIPMFIMVISYPEADEDKTKS